MLAFFGMSYQDGMSMPMHGFWVLSNSIGRIQAERDRGNLRIAIAAQSAKGANALMEELVEQVGQVVIYDKHIPPPVAVLDRQGLEELRNMR